MREDVQEFHLSREIGFIYNFFDVFCFGLTINIWFLEVGI